MKTPIVHNVFADLLIGALLVFSVAHAHSGCAGTSFPKVFGAVVDIGVCAASDYSVVKTALTEGVDPRASDATKAGDWISAIMELAHCVPQVIRDVESSPPTVTGELARAELIASVSPAPLPKRVKLDLATRRRIRAAKLLKLAP